MSLSIRQAAHTCLQSLQKALDCHGRHAPADQRTWVQRRIVDFNTWATLSGVFREGIYGLDAKLCLRPDLQAGLISLLQVFDALLSPMAEKLGSWRMHDIDEIEEKLSEIVSMTVYLRKSLGNTGLWPEHSAQTTTGVLKEVRPHLAPSRPTDPTVSSKSVPIRDHVGIIQDLRNRLEEAVSRRDKLFAGAQKRRARVVSNLNSESQYIWPPPKMNQFPPVPLVEATDTSFVCQFCCQVLPAFFSDAHAWREHFLQDLSPYTCVLPNCPQSHSVCGTRRDWEMHMKSVAHDGFDGRSWCCKVCQTDFQSMNQLLRHLRVYHIDGSTSDAEAQSPAEFTSFIKLDLSHLQVCFLCNEDVSGVHILDHIASCMEIFALKSLKSEQMAPPTISIQTDDEVDVTRTGTSPTLVGTSSDTVRLLVPPSSTDRSSRRANSLPEHIAETPDLRRSTKRKSMVEQRDYELTQDSELGQRYLETRTSTARVSGSTDDGQRSAKSRRLSNSSSVGSATMLKERRRRPSPSKGFMYLVASPEKSPIMLQRYLDEHASHEFLGQSKRSVSAG